MAEEAAQHLAPGTVFLDLNSASPGTKQQAAALIEAAGGRYLEAGVVDEFKLAGCPVYFDLVGKEKHEPGTPYTSKNTLAAGPKAKWQEAEANDIEDLFDD